MDGERENTIGSEPNQPNALNVGDRIKDNDPRRGDRVLEVVESTAEVVKAKDSKGRVFSILSRRIHSDGKPRTKGFNVVQQQS